MFLTKNCSRLNTQMHTRNSKVKNLDILTQVTRSSTSSAIISLCFVVSSMLSFSWVRSIMRRKRSSFQELLPQLGIFSNSSIYWCSSRFCTLFLVIPKVQNIGNPVKIFFNFTKYFLGSILESFLQVTGRNIWILLLIGGEER